MNGLKYYRSYKKLQYGSTHINKEDSPCHGIENISIFVQQNKTKLRKKYSYKVLNSKPTVILIKNLTGFPKSRNQITKHMSMPEINKPFFFKRSVRLISKSSGTIPQTKRRPSNTKRLISKYSSKNSYNFLKYININQRNFKVYRCQVTTNNGENCNNCCCSCNSDTMFEVMKDLYDCYKKRNCDNCNCILCCNLSAGERSKEISETRRELNLENALKEIAMKGFALPEGKSPSEKKLIDTIRDDLGLPPEPMSQDMREKYTNTANAGLMLPLEGKSYKEKEKILRDLHGLGIPLPLGRTPSEKSLIARIIGKGPQRFKSLADNIQDAKRSGLLVVDYEGRSPDAVEKIFKDVAMRGIPLPEEKDPLLKKLTDKVRTDLGLPPEPKTPSMREKHKKAAEAGLLVPLEGKSPEEKELILQGLANMQIPLPQGRTPSEKALIAKVQKRQKLDEKTASIIKDGKGPVDECICELLAPRHLAQLEKKRKAKVAGLLTPIKGKSKDQKEKILKGLAMQGLPLPKGEASSDDKLLKKVRADLGLPPEPKSSAMRVKYAKAAEDGILLPLEGKSPKEKEKILRNLHARGIPLPKGRTPSEKALIKTLKEPHTPSSSALSFKKPKEKASKPLEEKKLRDLAMRGLSLPEGKTESDDKLLAKVRAELGLPPEPKTPAIRKKYEKAADMGLMHPLEGKSLKEKETILRNLDNIGIPLPKGRTPSEKALIAKIKGEPRDLSMLSVKQAQSEKMRKAKDAGLLTPLDGKSPEKQEQILRGLGMMGIPLPIGNTDSQNNLINKIRINIGLPPEPKTPSMREKHKKAAEAGLLVPLDDKSPEEKELILQGLANMQIPLPQGRTPSEKALIAKVQKRQKLDEKTASIIKDGKGPVDECICELLAPRHLAQLEKKRKAKVAGLLTPIKGKSKDQKEKILKGLAMQGLPLPKAETSSDDKLLKKIRVDLGLPPEPKRSSMRARYATAADKGLLLPLEGKTPKEKENILRNLIELNIPLPKGRTPSEQALIDRVQRGEKTTHSPSEKMRAAKAAGLLTPLKGKTPAQKEKILRGLALNGLPLPEGKTKSEKNMLYKLRIELGLPPEPNTLSIRNKYDKAADAGILVPLEGKTTKEKEKILRQLADAGIPLPKARTPSEKAIINKIKGEPRTFPKVTTSEKMRRAQNEGLLTPLSGKTPSQIEIILRGRANLGIPLPEGKTSSEKNIIHNIRLDLGLPPEPKTPAMREKHEKAAAAGLLVTLEGKSPKEKQKILEGLADMGTPLPKGRTDSEKRLIAKVKGGMTPSKASKVPEPSITTEKIRQAKAAGLLTPLDKKSPEEKERILRNLVKLGLPLPDGKTTSEKSLINQIKKDYNLGKESSAEKIRKAKDAGVLTPLDGKTPEQKEKILRGRAAAGLPLPKGKSRSEKDLINKIKASTGYVSPSPSEAMQKAKAGGLLSSLDDKTPSEKEKRLRQMASAGISLPAGKTPSEKDMIKKVNAIQKSKSDKIKAAKASSQLRSLKGKTPEQKEKILIRLVNDGVPLPEGKTPSEEQIINKIRVEMGLPPSPKSPSMKEKYKKANAAGIITPLEGKTLAEKEQILRKLNKEGIPLPVGRTPSEKLLIKTVKAGLSEPSSKLEEMTPEKKEKVLRGLIKTGASLPDANTPSGKELIKKVRKEMGLPPEPKTLSMKEKMHKAQSAGLLTPLEGKTVAQKEKILRDIAESGKPLPEGKTPSEEALIRKIEDETKTKPEQIDEAQAEDLSIMKKAKDLGLDTSLEGKSPEEKEKILRGLAKLSLPLPEGTTKSEKQLIKNIRKDFALPPSPETSSMKKREGKAGEAGLQSKEAIRKPRSSKLQKAKELGLLTPLEGKSPEEKERILRGLANLSLPLPEGTTKSDKQLIKNIRKDLALPPRPETSSMKKREGKAAEAGLLYPLDGMTPAEKEKVLRAQANIGLRLPEGRTPSEKSLINKIKEEVALSKVPPENIRKAKEAGLLTPLKGKSQAERDRIIRGRAEAGLPLPEGLTSSEKSLIKKIGAEYRKPTSVIGPTGEKVGSKPKRSKLLTSLTGKTSAEIEKILHGLAEAGLPLPEGKTSTERALIKKIKGEHKTIKAESRETCERACGCDKKKIKFKHSYVKIRVTSPDISSLCPCPDECISGVKGGVFLDNDGIKVIIERAGDIHQYKQFGNITSKNLSYDYRNSIEKNNYVTDPVPMYSGVECKNYSDLLTSMYEDHSLKCSPNNNSHHSMTDIPLTYFSLSHERCHKIRQHTNESKSNTDNKICSIGKVNQSPIPSHDSLGSGLTYLTNPSTITSLSQNSFDSIIIIKSETSLSFSTSYEEIDSSSAFFSEISAITLKSSPYLAPLSNVGFNSSTIVESEFLTNGVKCRAADTNTSKEYIIRSSLIASTNKNVLVNRNQMPDDAFQVFPMSSTKLSTVDQIKCNKHKDDDKEPVIIITNLSSDLDLTSVVDDIISKKEFSEASSLFVVVPSDEENETCCNGLNCSQCNKLPENCNTSNNDNDEEMCSILDRTSSKIEDLTETKQKFFFEKVPTTIVSSINNKGNLYSYVKQGQNWLSGNKNCHTPNAMFHRCNVVSTDTTQDRPCCCGTIQSGACTNTMAEVITSEYITRGICSNKSVSRKNNVKQASIISLIPSPTVSVGQISECYQHPGMESPEPIFKYPLSTTEPGQPSKKFHSSATKHKKTRKKEQSDRRKYDSPTDNSDEEDMLETTAMTPATENYLICHEQKLKKKKITKWVCGAKEVRIDIACDCKHKNPSFIKTEEESENKMRELTERCCAAVPNRTKSLGQVISRLHRRPPVIKPGSLVSIGIQDSPGCILCLSGLPCTAKQNVSGHMTSVSNVHVFQQTPVNIYGHSNSTLSLLRSYAAIGSGGIYTQGGSKPTPCSIDAGVGVDFRNTSTEKYKSIYLNKQIQKNSYPYPLSTPRTNPIPRYTHRENEVGQNKITLMKPNITQTTSRMKFDNNVILKQHVKPSWTIEDLIRYYAKFKPEVLQTLISLTSIKKPVKDMTYNEDRRYEYRQQPGETSQLPYLPQNQEVPSKEAQELDNHPFTGFKIEKHGATLDALKLLKKRGITQQASFLSSSTISRCEINPCHGRQACHSPDEILQFPFGTPLSEPLLKLKKLLEQNCDPEKVQHIFQLIEAGNLKDIDWEDAMRSTSIVNPPSALGSSHALECQVTPCEGHPGCHAPDEVLQYPFGTPLSPNLLELKKLIEQNESEEKIKKLFGQMENRKLKNVNNETMKGSTNLQPNNPVSVSKLTSMSDCKGHPGCRLPLSKEKVKELFGQLQASNIKTCETLLKQSNNNPVLKPTKMSYRLPPKQEHSEYHCQNDFFINPLGPHLSPYLVELKNLLEQNHNPKEVKRIMKQIENGNLRNRNWEWETSTPTNTSPYDSLTSNVVPKNSISIVSSCHSPDELLQYPNAYLPAPLQTLKHVLERYYDPFKVQRLFKQIETGDYRNLDYIGALERPPPPPICIPVKKSPPMRFCSTNTCGRRLGPPGCHIPHDVLQYPHGTELITQLERLKKILECYQDPKVKCLFEPMEAGGLQNVQQPVPTAPSTSNCTDLRCPAHNQFLRYPFGTFLPKKISKMKSYIGQKIWPNAQWNVETSDTYTDCLPDNYQTLESGPSTSPYRSPSYQGHPGLPNQDLQHPFRTPLPQNLKELQEVLGHDIDPKKIKQLFEEIEADNLLNLDWECAMEILTELERDNFDDVDGTPTESGSMSQSEGLSQIGTGEENIQGVSKPTPHNIDVGVGVEFRNASTDTEQYISDFLNKQIQKNSIPYPQSAPRTKLIPRYMHRENEVPQNKVMLMTPNITQTASRRKFDNNVFLKQYVKPSWTIDDLIRYYAKFKPEVLQTLISLTSVKKPVVKDMMYNEDSRYVYRQQPADNSQLPYLPQSQGEPSKGSHEPESRPFTGFKIEKPGKLLVKEN